MDVQLPDGRILKGVPDGTTKAQLADKLKANGMNVPDAWMAPAQTQPQQNTAPTVIGNVPPIAPHPLSNPQPVQVDPQRKEQITNTILSLVSPAGSIKGVFAKEAGPALQAAQRFVSKGISVNPAEANPTLLNRLIETASGGKARVEASIALKNQPKWNSAVRSALGIPDNTPLTMDTLDAVRRQAGSVYSDVKNVLGDSMGTTKRFQNIIQAMRNDYGKFATKFPETFSNFKSVDPLLKEWKSMKSVTPDEAITAVKNLRAQATANEKYFGENMAAKKALAKVQRKTADAIDNLIEENLKMSGRQDLAGSYKAARKTIAMSYDVQSALNESTGNVSAQDLGRLLKKGKPLSGELRDVAEFARRYPRAAATPERVGSDPLISQLGAQFATVKAATSNPGWLSELVVPPVVRSASLTGLGQRSLIGTPGAAAPNPATAELYRALLAASGQYGNQNR